MPRRGFSLIEIVMVVTVLLVLSSFALPTAELAQVRFREKLLRERLRGMRQAIDKYRAARNDLGTIFYPPSIASLTAPIPASLLKAGADAGPFLTAESTGNPFLPRQDVFLWDIRDSSGIWYKNQENASAQLSCYDVRFPEDGVAGWKKAIDETLYDTW